jgi:hypothetical protein
LSFALAFSLIFCKKNSAVFELNNSIVI